MFVTHLHYCNTPSCQSQNHNVSHTQTHLSHKFEMLVIHPQVSHTQTHKFKMLVTHKVMLVTNSNCWSHTKSCWSHTKSCQSQIRNVSHTQNRFYLYINLYVYMDLLLLAFLPHSVIKFLNLLTFICFPSLFSNKFIMLCVCFIPVQL